MMKKIVLAVLMAFTVNAQAIGTYFNGNQFLEASESLKNGYVMGVVDAHAILSPVLKQSVFCEPNSATAGQLTAVVMKYLNNNPEKRHLAASRIVMVSLLEAFPCK